MCSQVSPPFTLFPPAAGKDEWKLRADLPSVELANCSVDLADREVRLQVSSCGGEPACLVCRLPEDVPGMDASQAVCRFSKRNCCLTVSWLGIASEPRSARQTVDPIGGVSLAQEKLAKEGIKDTAGLDARIDSLTEECLNLSGASASRKPSAEKDAYLARTVAAQVTRLLEGGVTGPDGLSGAEHLAGVVEFALMASGRAEEPAERSRLLILVGKTLQAPSKLLLELKLRVFEQAADALDEENEDGAPAESRGPSRTSATYKCLKGEALSLVGSVLAKQGELHSAEQRLHAAVALLEGLPDEAGQLLLASALKSLAEVCVARPAEARNHAGRAEAVLEALRRQRALERAEEALGFAAPASAERVPVRQYAYLDSETHATFRVDLDAALYAGASAVVTSKFQHLQLVFDSGSRESLELRICAPKGPGKEMALACWVLRLSKLYSEVLPEETELRLKNGVAVVKLRKADPGAWHDSPVKG